MKKTDPEQKRYTDPKFSVFFDWGMINIGLSLWKIRPFKRETAI